jgi:hypothetical protein
MRAGVLVVCLSLSSLAHGDPPTSQRFTLYKFQNQTSSWSVAIRWSISARCAGCASS